MGVVYIWVLLVICCKLWCLHLDWFFASSRYAYLCVCCRHGVLQKDYNASLSLKHRPGVSSSLTTHNISHSHPPQLDRSADYSTGYDGTKGGFGCGDRNADGSRILEFADGLNLVVCNTLFMKQESQLVTYAAAGPVKSTVINIIVRQKDKAKVRNVKVIPNEECVPKHKFVVMDMRHNTTWIYGRSAWKSWSMNRMNGIIEYQLQLKKDQQIASGLLKLLRHWKRWKKQSPRFVRACSRNDTNHRGYWNWLNLRVPETRRAAGCNVTYGVVCLFVCLCVCMCYTVCCATGQL